VLLLLLLLLQLQGPDRYLLQVPCTMSHPQWFVFLGYERLAAGGVQHA